MMDQPNANYINFGTRNVQGATPVQDEFDTLLAGGGPAGTSSAMRAAEISLNCLVIDCDDLVKRIQDYPSKGHADPSGPRRQRQTPLPQADV